MADWEKAVKGLECLWHCISPVGHSCGDCPQKYNRVECKRRVINDALSLLKAQEPRVIDADEIVLSAEPSKWLWVERKDDYCAEAFKAGKTISGLIAFECETPGAFLYCEYPGEYGKTWRCWSSRPTDEQRKATPWEPPKEET